MCLPLTPLPQDGSIGGELDKWLQVLPPVAHLEAQGTVSDPAFLEVLRHWKSFYFFSIRVHFLVLGLGYKSSSTPCPNVVISDSEKAKMAVMLVLRFQTAVGQSNRCVWAINLLGKLLTQQHRHMKLK